MSIPDRIWINEKWEAYLRPTFEGDTSGYIRADIAAVQPAQVRVKPLMWRESSAELPRHAWEAWSSLGRYVIVQHFIVMNSAVYRLNGNNYHTIEAAKAAAQADYEARILAALEPQPDPRDEVIARLVEALGKFLIEYDEVDLAVPEPQSLISAVMEARSTLAAAKAVQHG